MVNRHQDWLVSTLDALFLVPGGGGWANDMVWDWIITVGLGFTGVALATIRSTWAIDFAVYVFVFNRGLRRMVDYYIHDAFIPLNPISLTPLIVAGAMLIPVTFHAGRFPPRIGMVLWLLAAAILYSFAIGFVRVKLAALYALAECLSPLAMFAFVLLLRPDTKIKDRWVRSFAWAAILTSIYGWYQYLTIPPWDKFWLIETKLYGYMGVPVPTQMTVFSTMAERGPLAGFLGFSVVPMIVSKKWRPLPGFLGWAGVILVFSAILLTLSRGGLLFAIIGAVTYLLINRGRGARQIALAVALVGAAAAFGMERIPNAERITSRFETLGEMNEDGSYQGRVQIMSSGFGELLQRPMGMGLGAVGLATRVNTGTISNDQSVTVSDAGWFNLALTYGIPGTVMLLVALVSAWRLLDQRFRSVNLRDDHVLLARAMMLTLVPTCFVGDLLTGFSIFWLALGCGVVLPPAGQRNMGGADRRMPAPLQAPPGGRAPRTMHGA